MYNLYQVSQQVWNQLRNVCKQSKHRLQKKVCIMLLKIAFSAFFVNCKIKNGFFSNFSPISNNLLNKLLHKIIGEKLLKNSIFNSCSSQKRLKKQFFEAKYIFFINVARFARKLLGLRTLHSTYSKHVGTPCTSDFLDKKCHFGSVWRLL